MKIKKKIITIIILLLLIGGLGVVAINLAKSNVSTDSPSEPVVIEKDDYTEYIELYNQNKEINDDYCGQLRFESGLIDLPFVQGATNDTYLRTAWDTGEYSEYGSLFLDYRNYLEYDNNLIIYGHHVYHSYDESDSKMFTPLQLLREESNYDDNKYIDLIYGDHYDRYEIAVVYICDVYEKDGHLYTNDSKQYYHTNYDADYFEVYKAAIYDCALYQTGVDITYADKLLTLQTCIENTDDKLIVLAHLIETVQY